MSPTNNVAERLVRGGKNVVRREVEDSFETTLNCIPSSQLKKFEMKFYNCPPPLRNGVLGLTLCQVFIDHKFDYETGFISLNDVDEDFLRYTGQNLENAFKSMDQTVFEFVEQHFSEFVECFAFDRRPGFMLHKGLTLKHCSQIWDSKSENAPVVFDLDSIDTASALNVKKTSVITHDLDHLAAVSGGITTKSGSALSVSSAESTSEWEKQSGIEASSSTSTATNYLNLADGLQTILPATSTSSISPNSSIESSSTPLKSYDSHSPLSVSADMKNSSMSITKSPEPVKPLAVVNPQNSSPTPSKSPTILATRSLTRVEMSSLVNTAQINPIAGNYMNVVMEGNDFPRTIGRIPASDQPETLCFDNVKFDVNHNYIITNFDAVFENRNLVVASTRKLPLNMTLCRWIDGFPFFADVILYFQYANHFFKKFQQPITPPVYHNFVKALVKREVFFQDVALFVGNLQLMLTWDFIRFASTDDSDVSLIINPIIQKLPMTPLGNGMPSLLFFILTKNPDGLTVIGLLDLFQDTRDDVIKSFVDTINNRPDLFVLSPPENRRNGVNLHHCTIKLSQHVSPLTAVYNYQLNDLSLAKELHLRSDHIDSISQFA